MKIMRVEFWGGKTLTESQYCFLYNSYHCLCPPHILVSESVPSRSPIIKGYWNSTSHSLQGSYRCRTIQKAVAVHLNVTANPEHHWGIAQAAAKGSPSFIQLKNMGNLSLTPCNLVLLECPAFYSLDDTLPCSTHWNMLSRGCVCSYKLCHLQQYMYTMGWGEVPRQRYIVCRD